MIHYGTLISNGKSERPGGIKSGASGDLAISKEFKVFMFAALVDFIFLIQTGSFWVEQNKNQISFIWRRRTVKEAMPSDAFLKSIMQRRH